MARVTNLAFVAAALAMAALPFAGSPAGAFTLQNSDGSSAGSARFSDPDDAVKNFGSTASPFGQGGPTVQFNAGPSGVSPTGRFSPLQGFSSGPRPPDPYGPRSLGNND
jgi:hypothetical protein